KASGREYLPMAEARGQLEGWLADPRWDTIPLVNNLQGPVFRKHLALPAVLDFLRERFGLRGMMSGSGSSCFVLPDDDLPGEVLHAAIVECLGEDCLVVDTRLA